MWKILNFALIFISLMLEELQVCDISRNTGLYNVIFSFRTAMLKKMLEDMDNAKVETGMLFWFLQK